MPTLHQMQISGNSYKVRIAAHELGLALKLVDYGVHDGTTRTPAFLARNPNGRVPMLETDDGRYLPESGAILFYLTEGTHLQPADRWGRAEMLQWMFFEQYSHEPYVAVARFILKYATPEMRERRMGELPLLMERGNAALGVMQAHLAKRDWFAGGAFSIADIALYGYTHSAGDCGFDLSRYPGIVKWMERIATRPRHISMDTRW